MAAALVPWSPASASGTSARLRFERISLSSGLSQSTVYSITQDHFGFLWVGSDYGLNRYDGYSFTVYTSDPGDPSTLSANEIRSVLEDAQGTLWIGTRDAGLNCFDRSTEAFTRFRHDPNDSTSLSGDEVRALALDSEGAVWVGTSHGLDRVERAAGRMELVRVDLGRSTARVDANISITALLVDASGRLWVGAETGLFLLTRERGAGLGDPIDPAARLNVPLTFAVSCLAEDRRGDIWVGTGEHGVFRLDHETGKVTAYRHDPTDPATLSSDFIASLLKDSSGAIWVGTAAGGLNLVDPASGRFTRVPVEPEDPQATSGGWIGALFEDRSEILWIGTDFGGLNRVDLKGSAFRTLSAGRDASSSLARSVVFAVFVDSESILWVGTQGGLDRVDPISGVVTHMSGAGGILPPRPTYALEEDREGNLWVGTWGAGLFRIDPTRREATPFRHDPVDPDSLASDIVMAVQVDRAGRVWVATWGGGLDSLDGRTQRFRHHVADGRPGALESNHIHTLFEDSRGILWVGTTAGGLGRLDPDSGRFTAYRHRPGDPTSLSDDDVSSVCEDHRGNIWVGTGGGLCRLDTPRGAFTRVTRRDGLPNDAITGVLEDTRGRLWVAHFQGLSRFDPETMEFRSFDVSDGLPSNEFNSGASFKDRQGRMYFGGVAGLTSFDPEQVRGNPYPPTVAITSFAVYGKPTGPGGPIVDADTVRLSHRDDFLAFDFVGLELTAPERIRYAYTMEGLDRGWVDSGVRRYASYANVPPGTYVFKVKAANNHGVWSVRPASLQVVIAPPFWQRLWFRGLAVAVIGLSFAAVHAWRTAALRRRVAEQERVVAERTRQLAAANRDLAALAREDPLTGVANRRRFEEFLDEEWRRASRFERPVSLLMIDIDHFKSFNDRLGHPAGDACLQRVAGLLQDVAGRPGDLVARYGGEEFVIVLSETGLEVAEALAERLRDAVASHSGDVDTSVTVSIGVTTATPTPSSPWTAMLEIADTALYRAKARGRNRVVTAQ